MRIRIELELDLEAHCRAQRNQQGRSLEDIAAAVNCARSKFSRLERGLGWGVDLPELLVWLKLLNSPVYPVLVGLTDQLQADLNQAIAAAIADSSEPDRSS